MTHQEHAEIISDEVRDEIRLYECARKYEIIVKQFDELVGIMNTVPKTKWRKVSSLIFSYFIQILCVFL